MVHARILAHAGSLFAALTVLACASAPPVPVDATAPTDVSAPLDALLLDSPGPDSALADRNARWPAPSASLTAVQLRVLQEVVALPSLDHDLTVYGLPEPLTPGAAIGPADASPGSAPLALTEPTWFFFVDDAPQAFFGHAVRFVTIGSVSGTLLVTAANAWPVRGGVPVFAEGADGKASPHIVYTTLAASLPPPPPPPDGAPPAPAPLPPPPPPGCPDGTPAKRFALLIQGSGAHAHVMKNSVKAVGGALAAAGGFAPVQIVNAGTAKGMRDQIKAAVAALGGSMRCCDEVFIYLNGHGHRLVEAKDAKGKPTGQWQRVNESGTVVGSGGGALAGQAKVPPNAPSRWQFFVAPGEFLPADELFALLQGLKSCHLTLLVESCFSGALLDEATTLPGIERLLTSQNRASLSPTDDAANAKAPATDAMLGGLKLAADTALGDQVAAAFGAGKKTNKFAGGGGDDPRGSGDAGAYAKGQTRKDGKATWHAFPQAYERSDQATPCPCCRNGKKEADEQCDPGPPQAVACPVAGHLCLQDCTCAVCTKGHDGTIPTRSAPGKACTGTPVKASYTVTPGADGTSHKLQATLSATFTSPTQSGMFVRLVRQDGAKLYVGAIGKQYTAYLRDKGGKLVASYPCSGTQTAAPDPPGWVVTADPIPTDALKTVISAQIEVTDGNCSGSFDAGLPGGGACPW